MAIFHFKVTGKYEVDLPELLDSHGLDDKQDEFDLLESILQAESHFLKEDQCDIAENITEVHVDFDDINLVRRELEAYRKANAES